jgi:hypothetical protein
MRHRTPPTRSRVIKPQCETAARSPLQPFDAASLGLPSERVQDVSAAAPLHAPATTTPRKRLAPRVPKPDPWLLLRQLKIILDEGQPELWAPDFGGCDNRGLCGGLKDRECRLDTSHLGPCICSFLDIDDILALHERDVMEWGQSRRSFARTSDDERLRA